MPFMFSFTGFGVVVLCIAMSLDAYQTEIDSGVDVGPWAKVLAPMVISNFGVALIIEGVKMSIGS